MEPLGVGAVIAQHMVQRGRSMLPLTSSHIAAYLSSHSANAVLH